MDKISIIMGIYNCADTLDESIQCIINQSYQNWELIMCDDGSTDDTYKVAEKYLEGMPDKIVLIKNKKNEGLNKTLNKCLKRATGNYIARMDGDDLCSYDRLEKELNFLKANPEFDIVSTNMTYFDNNGIFAQSNMKEYPEKEDFAFGTQFCHAPCMVTRRAYESVGGYTVNKRLIRVEDYELWVKMYAMGYKGYNIQEPLYSMRDDRNAAIRRKKFRLNEVYVRFLAIKMLRLPKWKIIYAVKPVLVGLLPIWIYRGLRKKVHM